MDRSPRWFSTLYSKGACVLVFGVTFTLLAFLFFPSGTFADEGVAPVIVNAVITLNPPAEGDISSFPSAATILPTASTTVSAWVEILVSDEDGWEDIDPDSLTPASIAYSGYLKEDTVGPCAEGPSNGEDDYQCYTPISFDACSLVAHTTNEVLVSCPFEINYYTKPGSWTLSVDVVDKGGLTDNSMSAESVGALLAYTVDLTALDFGAVSIPVTTLDNSNKEIHFANAGNVAIADLQVDLTDMACLFDGVTPSGTISVDGLAYSTSSLAGLWDFAVTGTYTGTDFAFPIPVATTNTSEGYQSAALYHHLRYVNVGMAGVCSGAVTFTPSS